MSVDADNSPAGTGLLLQNFEIFRGLTSVECADGSKLTRPRTYKPGAKLSRRHRITVTFSLLFQEKYVNVQSHNMASKCIMSICMQG